MSDASATTSPDTAPPAAGAGAGSAIELLVRAPAGEASSHYDRSLVLWAKAGEAVARAPQGTGPSAVGEGVSLDADGVTLVASVDGRVLVEDGRVRVEPSLLIDGNVDFTTGNVDFPRDVLVGGGVYDLFKLTAGGDVQVQGVIEAADVRAGGHLRAAGGISAKGKGRCAAGGDVVAKYIANATVVAGGDVTALMVAQSRVVCGSMLKVTQGPLLAGHVTAAAGVSCVVLGSPAGVKTVVEAGVDETLRAAAVAKVPEIDSLRAKAAKIRQAVQPLMRNQKQLTPQQKERATELLFEADECEAQAEAMLAPLRKAHEAAQARAKSMIEVSDTLYTGVVIRFPGLYTVIDSALKGPMRVTTKKMHNETRIVVTYGPGGAAHALATHAGADDGLTTLKKLLQPPEAAPAAA